MVRNGRRCGEPGCDGSLSEHERMHETLVGPARVVHGPAMTLVCDGCGSIELSGEELSCYERRAARALLLEGAPDGATVRFARKALGLTRAELARAVGIADWTVTLYESGGVVAPQSVRSAIIALLEGGATHDAGTVVVGSAPDAAPGEWHPPVAACDATSPDHKHACTRAPGHEPSDHHAVDPVFGNVMERWPADGLSQLAPLAARIAKGRAKYPTGCTVLSLLDEAGEVAHAINKDEGPERARDELLDVAAVAVRLYLGEVDTNSTLEGLSQRRTGAVAPLGPTERTIHHLLHRLWTQAVGMAGYDKKDWLSLEAGIYSLQRGGT